jgi:antitoxin VapB
MNLQIRNPKAYALARRLSLIRRVSMTDAVIDALESAVERQTQPESRREALERLQEELRRSAGPRGQPVTKEDIDGMWGHPPDGGK